MMLRLQGFSTPFKREWGWCTNFGASRNAGGSISLFQRSVFPNVDSLQAESFAAGRITRVKCEVK